MAMNPRTKSIIKQTLGALAVAGAIAGFSYKSNSKAQKEEADAESREMASMMEHGKIAMRRANAKINSQKVTVTQMTVGNTTIVEAPLVEFKLPKKGR